MAPSVAHPVTLNEHANIYVNYYDGLPRTSPDFCITSESTLQLSATALFVRILSKPDSAWICLYLCPNCPLLFGRGLSVYNSFLQNARLAIACCYGFLITSFERTFLSVFNSFSWYVICYYYAELDVEVDRCGLSRSSISRCFYTATISPCEMDNIKLNFNFK